MKNGFTLAELSIVLVIIGLLIGGILVGQSLVESAKINSYMKSFKQYEIAISIFHNKFRYLPGDLPSNLQPSSSLQISDGRADFKYGGRNGHTQLERVYAFGDLSAFKIISENFSYPDTFDINESGLTWPGRYIPELGNNIGMTVKTVIDYSGNNHHFSNSAISALPQCDIFLVIQYMRDATKSSGLTPYPFMKGTNALALDAKLDDGKPTQGNLLSSGNHTNLDEGCYNAVWSNITTTYSASHEYNIDSSVDTTCYPIYCLEMGMFN